MLGFEPVQTLALAIHELATNAIQHGALKGDDGKLEVSWRTRSNGDDGALLTLEWRETGVTEMPPQNRAGFGRELIEQALAFTLRASTTMMFEKDGMVCTIEMPIPRQPTSPTPDVRE
jgi:two-component system, chemotaxis family, CheB/CheR fusion protein